jgi:hypothetical protein
MEEVSSESIVRHSTSRAKEQAVIVWALASAQYPLDHGVIQQEATVLLIESISNFSLNARRALESISGRTGIKLEQPRWRWVPKTEGEVAGDLWDSLNRIIHARKLEVGWEELPSDASVIAAGAIVVPYIQAETDRRPLAFIDPFAQAHAFLYHALPLLESGFRTTLPVQ